MTNACVIGWCLVRDLQYRIKDVWLPCLTDMEIANMCQLSTLIRGAYYVPCTCQYASAWFVLLKGVQWWKTPAADKSTHSQVNDLVHTRFSVYFCWISLASPACTSNLLLSPFFLETKSGTNCPPDQFEYNATNLYAQSSTRSWGIMASKSTIFGYIPHYCHVFQGHFSVAGQF